MIDNLAINEQVILNIIERKNPPPILLSYYIKCLHKILLINPAKLTPPLAQRIEEWKKDVEENKKYIKNLINQARGHPDTDEVLCNLTKDVIWAIHEDKLNKTKIKTVHQFSVKGPNYTSEINTFIEREKTKDYIVTYIMKCKCPKKIERLRQCIEPFSDIQYADLYCECGFCLLKYKLIISPETVLPELTPDCIHWLVKMFYKTNSNKTIIPLLLISDTFKNLIPNIIKTLSSTILKTKPYFNDTVCHAHELLYVLLSNTNECPIKIMDHIIYICAVINNIGGLSNIQLFARHVFVLCVSLSPYYIELNGTLCSYCTKNYIQK